MYMYVVEVEGGLCDFPPETGPCKARFPRFYYNSRVGKCLKFIYGGCGGNPNNFETIRECQGVCSE